MIFSIVEQVAGANRARKRTILVAYDVLAMFVALWAAFSARLGEVYVPDNPTILAAAALSIGVGVIGLFQLRVYRIVLRFFDLRTVSRIFFGAAIAAVAWVIIVYFSRASMVVDQTTIFVPRSVGFIYCGFLFVLLFMGRYIMTSLLAGAVLGATPAAGGGKRVIAIYGANSAGVSLGESVRRDAGCTLAAFVDDDPALTGQILLGAPIYSPEALPDLIAEAEVSAVFLALPKATRSQRLSAISRLKNLNVDVKTVPAPEEIVSGRFTVSDVRPIQVNDLLRRDPVEPLSQLIRKAVDGHRILITGAGGSIGSEICRQIVRGVPEQVVLLDHSEYALFTIEQHLSEILQQGGSGASVVPIVGSMLNSRLLRDTIRKYQIDTIYHAAAYKHVPLLENNEPTCVENNVLGTLNLATIAQEENLTRFTMISTDKAVRPRSVMGASKRIAELVVQALAAESSPTKFGIVRFGNVLDSSGSVVQRFREQISRGGPVTVTHRDVTRFFMSIPEATQLVLQASAMAQGGEVFVLDMGEPVRIAELARNMIELSGLTVRDDANPTGDIEVTLVGLRPGEKLYEELFVGEDAVPTAHPRIRMARERFVPMRELLPSLEELRSQIASGDSIALRRTMWRLLEPDLSDVPDNVTILRRA
jgi:UDP-N-acetylglucosamine 4,6-dehydratase